MPRKKLARRFEPRGGVSESMLDAESQYVKRELDDYLLLSINDLREKLAEHHRRLGHMELSLQACLTPLADRERLALKCMFARDLYHVAALYDRFLRSPDAPQTTGVAMLKEEEVTKDDEVRPIIAFAEFLFES
jgi:hypothetical protein